MLEYNDEYCIYDEEGDSATVIQEKKSEKWTLEGTVELVRSEG